MTDEAAPPDPPKTGAQKRKRKLDAEVTAAASGPDDGKWANDFKKAGKPDLENPETDLMFVRKLQLIAMGQMATTPFPSLAQKNCWQRIREMSAVVGMTSNRAALEARTKKLEKLLADSRQGGGVVVVPGTKIKKSPNARGTAPLGPRPLPPEEPDGLPQS